ncbi:glycosyltransferase family 4 protein [Psychroflexus sp. CAK8W]|uniref:Glycosyltransferase family 4 protein n=1 Tax=Psychroflexus longus TaxID=2873596 RepID=A0ABS7XKC3_9FLAO|nr:glycosyltransferase family 4 protein [Psychroflexus longus]MBZ9779437.1 glycosyltransferase family 4 protein [Psychroflexus longus]
MKLIIFDGTFKTTTFINRLIQGLVNHDVEVYVLGFNEEVNEKLKGVHYVGLGSSQSRIKFAWTSLKWGLKHGNLLKAIRLLTKEKKSELKRQNLSAALEQIQPDLIQVQWVSNISLFEEHLNKKEFKFILSQRGFQTNVRPFVNQKSFEYLHKWLPEFDGFHSVSKAISKVGDDLYTHPNKIDQVVYTGLDLAEFNFQSEVIKNETLQLISVGRSHWIKGYNYVIKACSILRQKGIDFKYTIVGALGDEELLFLIDDMGLRDKVILTPKSPQTKVFEMMKASDLFLLPSLEEGIANVAVEAMALGTPVISTDCGGMEELTTHGEEGWIVPKRDAEAMAEQVLSFSKLEEDEIRLIKVAARQKVEQQHNERQMVEGMLRLYNRVIE